MTDNRVQPPPPPPRQDSLSNPSVSPIHATLPMPGMPGRPLMPPDGRNYFDSPSQRRTSVSNTAQRKRSRTASTVPEDGRQNSPPKKEKKEKDKDTDEPPSVLVREKKQKACANCRRAKLKCIVEGNETECVRCRARKERCVFYPRGHDEDWQQTLTSDLYTAIGHLSQLSAAVHHILHHLTAQGMVPPLEQQLPHYGPPDRDLSILQGWGAERNRALGSTDNGRKRMRRKKEDDGDDDDDDDDEQGMSNAPFSADYQAVANTNGNAAVPAGGMRPTDMHMPPPRFERVPSSISNSGNRPPPPAPLPQHPPMLGSAQSGSVGLPFQEPNGRSMSAGTRPTPEGAMSISPVDSATFGVTPGQTSQPSSAITTAPAMSTPYPAQGGIFSLLNGTKSSASPSSAPVSTQQYDNDQFGSADPRPNIVKRGVITNNDALTLVDL